MATYNYTQVKEFEEKRANRTNTNTGDRVPVHFMSEFLKNSGDSCIVRFPYTTTNEFQFESVHRVMNVFPGRFGTSVRCTGDKSTCPLCQSEETNFKTIKFYTKFIVYKTLEDGSIEPVVVTWERPKKFADKLASIMSDYGPLTDTLIRITKTGSGTDTDYDVMIPNMNSPVLKNPAYSADALNLLDGVDPISISSKSLDRYLERIGETPVPATTSSTTAQTSAPKTFNTQPVAQTAEVVEPAQPAYARQEAPAQQRSTTAKRYTNSF